MELLSISTLLFLLAGVFLAIFFIVKQKTKTSVAQKIKIQEPIPIKKQDYGTLQIFFGSQTGTAAKMAEGFVQQAEQHGFKGTVIDLKDLSIEHFKQNQISIFFLSNTGQGQAPENCVMFMKLIQAKNYEKVQLNDNIQQLTPQLWKNISFTVFGLGNTQYEHYNKTAIDADQLLSEKGARRIYKIGLGDNNASLQDDYNEWKQDLWKNLKSYRQSFPMKIQRKKSILQNQIKNLIEKQNQLESNQYISKQKPSLANFRLKIVTKEQIESLGIVPKEQQLDFKTKAYKKSKICKIISIQQTRQNTKDGSSLELVVNFPQLPEYQTAGNLALWAENDPKLIDEVCKYFNLAKCLDKEVTIQHLSEKKLSLNFIYPLTIRKLITEHIDLQGKVTKSILKKLSKFQSKDKQYFVDNSSPKTTAQYQRLNKIFIYPFKLVKQYNIKLTFQDFVQICDSMAPRLFTIASSYKKQKDAVIVASIVEDGLISNNFLRYPTTMRGQLRSSTFTDAMKRQKVLFVSAGTGFAPFRGFLKEKQYYEQKSMKTPIVSLFFGCKHQTGDFIYKDLIKQWIEKKIINQFYGAFSRDTDKKVYVQHLLKRQKQQLRQYIMDENCAMYLCGALSMGKDVTDTITTFLKQQMGYDDEKTKNCLADLQKKGRFVKQLW